LKRTRLELPRAVVAALLAQLAAEAPAFAQARAQPVAAVEGFEIAPDARRALHAIWQSSVAAGVEGAACIGGDRQGGVAHITRVLPLTPTDADSLAVSAVASIERCGPPNWFGTAHTHIALYDGQHPYPNFSGADRGVMGFWLERWTTDGVFCVLYSATAAHCEAAGAAGSLVAGPETAASY
jgi:hypothetical protein